MEFFPSRAVALTLGPLSIHWYGLLYLAAFVVGIVLLPRLQRYRDLGLTKDQWMSFASWMIAGVLIGGRLGYVLFYDLPFFLERPWEVIMVWHGGMASHGGFLGVILALWLFCRRTKVSFRRLADVLVIPVAIGLALGRFGNFINQELYGIPTTLPWGIAIPGAEGLRHPTQLYGFLKDLLIALLCFLHLRRRPFMPGTTAALFLMLYGLLRFMNEYLREQTAEPTDVLGLTLTRGQLLTIPVFVAGVVLWVLWSRQEKR